MTTPPEILAAMETVLLYLWEDEQADFIGEPTEDHVFLSLLAVRGWLSFERRRQEKWKEAGTENGTGTGGSRETAR